MEQSRQGARAQNQGGRNRLVTGISKYINKEVTVPERKHELRHDQK